MVLLKKLFWVPVIAALLLIVSVGQVVSAQGYGRSSYGSCAYGKPCGNTVVTTPNGLQVAINLKDGQVMPREGYTIIITPLNGSGSSFAKADIYIDSVLRGSTTPGQNGTATWFWDVLKYPGTQVRVVVFDTDGRQIVQDFTVSIAPEGSEGAPAGSGNPGGSSNSGGEPAGLVKQSVIGKIIGGAQDIVRQLPQDFVRAFPWLLFLLLLIEIMLLIWQTRREIKELHVLEGLIEREHSIAGLKTGLLQLVSHYLRTPFTILRSGAEGIEKYGMAPEVTQRIQQAIKGLGTSIEGLIAQVDDQAALQQAAVPAAAVLDKRYARQRFIVWLPVIFIGVVATLFVWLAYSINRLSGGFVTLLTYISMLVILVIGIWLISRRLYLKRRDTESAQVLLSEATAMQARRDTFIRDAAGMLGDYIQTLRQNVQYIPSTVPMAKFITKGIDQLTTIQAKFVIATQLQGSRSTDLYKVVSLRQLYDQVAAKLAESAQAKQIKLSLVNDADLVIQDENLTLTVLQSLLDNAIAYSSEGGDVAVSGQLTASAPTIAVLDHGAGIPKDKLDVLFQPFSKVEGAETFTHEGMGFSLYLDKLIMAYLGGDIAIESVPQQKTEATMTLSPGLK